MICHPKHLSTINLQAKYKFLMCCIICLVNFYSTSPTRSNTMRNSHNIKERMLKKTPTLQGSILVSRRLTKKKTLLKLYNVRTKEYI